MNVEIWTGISTPGSKNGSLREASFQRVSRPCSLPNGEIIVPDDYNFTIRSISVDGIVSTLAGKGNNCTLDGPSKDACFMSPVSAFPGSNGDVYIGESDDTVRLVTRDGMVSTVVEPRDKGQDEFRMLYGVTLAPNGDLYISEGATGHLAIHRSGSLLSVLGKGDTQASDGTDDEISFICPSTVRFTEYGDCFICDHTLIRTLTIRSIKNTLKYTTTTFIGTGEVGKKDGPRLSASLNGACDLIVIPGGKGLLIAEQYNGAVRRLGSDGMITTLWDDKMEKMKCFFGFCSTLAGDLLMCDLDKNNILISRRILLPRDNIKMDHLMAKYTKNNGENDQSNGSLIVPPQLVPLAYTSLKERNFLPIHGWEVPETSLTALRRLLIFNEYPTSSLELLHLFV
jgi:hypothetical protein